MAYTTSTKGILYLCPWCLQENGEIVASTPSAPGVTWEYILKHHYGTHLMDDIKTQTALSLDKDLLTYLKKKHGNQ